MAGLVPAISFAQWPPLAPLCGDSQLWIMGSNSV
jgi:hypothetical protein